MITSVPVELDFLCRQSFSVWLAPPVTSPGHERREAELPSEVHPHERWGPPRDGSIRGVRPRQAGTVGRNAGSLRHATGIVCSRLRDPVGIAFSSASTFAGVAILALMIWRPGA